MNDQLKREIADLEQDLVSLKEEADLRSKLSALRREKFKAEIGKTKVVRLWKWFDRNTGGN